MIGQLLAGHYKVLEVLGEGGFGQTYIVEDIHLPGHPKCVLKHLKTTSTDPESLETARRLFQKEAETLQQLGNHDQIPRLLAYFEENREFYLVQEFINGHTLGKELLPGKKWTESQIIEMLIEVLSILEFVHSHGVIHRDIKPDNIIRRASDKKLVLIDFGAIKQLRSPTACGTGKHHITLIIGTRGYMPSEQTRRLPRPSSDIYALGMMGIQALTGIYPHELQDDPNTGEILWQHLTPTSPGLATVLAKMTRYHFKDRYQSANEALQVLEELAANAVDISAAEALQVLEQLTNGHADAPLMETSPGTTVLHELILEWEEGGQVKTRRILEKQHSKNPGKIRIGRDPLVCDIVLSDPTISGLHVEIFFHSDKQRFYLRNLRQKNPPIVDGQLLLAGEIPLSVGSHLRLGQQNFYIRHITTQEYPAGYTPKEYALVHIGQQQPVAQTVRFSRVKQPQVAPAPARPAPVKLSTKKLSSYLGIGAAAFVSALGGFMFTNSVHVSRSQSQQNLILQQPQLCRVISPPGGRYLAKLRPLPHTEIGAMKQLNIGEKVLFLRTQGDFVEVKLADGTQGWLWRDEIQPCIASKATQKALQSHFPASKFPR